MAFTLETIRREFPVMEHCTYLDVSTQGPISRSTRASVEAHLDNRLHENDDEMAMLELVEDLRAVFASFINAGPDEIAVTKNASEGINIVASAMRFQPHDNVVLCPALEHANNVLPWFRLERESGVEIRAIPAKDGHLPSEAMAEAVDSRTRVVTLSTASLAPGFLADTRPIAEACKEHGALFLADGAQSVGVIETDVRKLGLDALAVPTLKGLVGMYGLGFLYCRREWAERLHNAHIARFSIDMGNAPESAPAPADYRLRAGAKRFDIGHYNVVGAVAARTAIMQLKEIGAENIEKRVRSLAHRLTTGLLDAGLPVCGGVPGPHTGNIVSVGKVGAADRDPNHAEMAELHAHMGRENVRCAFRRGLLRLSLHVYNNDDDVDRVVSIARAWRAGRKVP